MADVGPLLITAANAKRWALLILGGWLGGLRTTSSSGPRALNVTTRRERFAG